MKHNLKDYIGKYDALVIPIRGGFYKGQAIYPKWILKDYPDIGRDTYFVLENFVGMVPYTIRTVVISALNTTEIVAFPITKGLTNEVSFGMVKNGIKDLNRMAEILNWKKIAIVLPERWKNLKLRGLPNGTEIKN